jgi:hypothetical protein
MTRLLIVAALAGLTATAVAQPAELALGAAQLDLAPRRDLLSEEATGPYWRGAAFAQLAAGTASPVDVGVGAAAALSGIGCDLISGAVQGRLRPQVAERAVGSAQWSLCLSRVGLTLAFSGAHEVAVAPALDGRRSLWRRRYDGSTERLTVGGGELWRRDSRHRHSFMMITLGHSVVQQRDDDGDGRSAQLEFGMSTYAYRFAGRTTDAKLELGVVEGAGLKVGADDRGGTAFTVAPVRLRIDRDGWSVAAHGGWGFTGGKLTASSETKVNGEVVDQWSETIDGAGLPVLTIPVGAVTASIATESLSLRAEAARTVFPTFDGNVAAEDRVAAGVDGVSGRASFSLAPFATRTRTWTRDAGRSVDHAVGLSASLGTSLTEHLRADAYGEFGRSPYVRLDGDRAPRAAIGGQVVVALTARAAR